MYWAYEMVPKREKSQVNSIHNVGFIISFIRIYHATDTVHVNAVAIRKLMCGVRAIILSLRPVS